MVKPKQPGNHADSKDAVDTTLLMALVLLLGCLLKHPACSCNAVFDAAAWVFFKDLRVFQTPAASYQSFQPLCWAELSCSYLHKFKAGTLGFCILRPLEQPSKVCELINYKGLVRLHCISIIVLKGLKFKGWRVNAF